MKTLLNVDASTLVNALNVAKPLTVRGQASLEQVRSYINGNALTAHGVIHCQKLLGDVQQDIGLEHVIQEFSNLVQAENKMIAIAYETLANQAIGFGSVGLEATNILADLYQHNAATIIDEINNGALDKYKYNSVIASLIHYAKSARKNKISSGLSGKMTTNYSDVVYRLMPMFTVAGLPDGTSIMFIDGKYMLQGKRGGLSNVDAKVVSDITGGIGPIATALSITMPKFNEPNVLTFNDLYSKALERAGIPDMSIDLLADAAEKIRIGERAMTVAKFKALLTPSNAAYVAELTLSYDLRGMMQTIMESIDVLVNIPATSIKYAYKFTTVTDDVAVYTGRNGNRYYVIEVVGGVTTSVTTYDNAFAMLSNNALISLPKVHRNVQELYEQDLKQAENQVASRKALLSSLAEERSKYVELRKRLQNDIETLEQTADANPEKVEQLTDLLDKVDANIAKTDKSMSNIKS